MTVTDPGSSLRFQIVDVGGEYAGTLDIVAGAHVYDLGADVGEAGDGAVNVAGVGSVWDNRNGLFVSGTEPQGSVSVTDHGTVRFGAYGLQISGAFALDGTAGLVGQNIVLAGGSLTALATTGAAATTVTIAQPLMLSYNPLLGGDNTGDFVGSAPGATLVLQGAVTPQFGGSDPLAVGGGHVVLDNAGNGDFQIDLYGGVLEAAQAAALGGGGISFLGSAGATLQLDQTGALADPISGFGLSAQDVIDLQAIVFTPAPVLSWHQADTQGGTLTVSDGAHAIGLMLNGRYLQSGFHAAADGHGGTAIGYQT